MDPTRDPKTLIQRRGPQLSPATVGTVKANGPIAIPSVPPAPQAEPVAPAGAAPRLLDRLREAIRVRHYSIRTEATYVDWVRRFILFHAKRHPRDMGAAEVSAFLTHLAVNRGVAPSIARLSRGLLTAKSGGW